MKEEWTDIFKVACQGYKNELDRDRTKLVTWYI